MNHQPRSRDHLARETIRLHGPGDLLTAVAYLLGYRPDEPSLVVAGLRGREVAVVARLELPALTDLPRPDVLASAWASYTRPLQAAAADAVAVLGYAEAAWEPAFHAFVDAAPLPVSDAVRVHADRWWSLDCPHTGTGPGCARPGCRPDGAPVVDDPAVTVPLIAGGTAAPGTRSDLTEALRPGPAELIREVTDRLTGQPPRTRADLHRAVIEARQAREGGPDPLPAGQAAVLLTAVADVHVRDACMAWTDDAAWWLWHDLIRAAPPGHIAPVAMLIAITAYQRGDGVTAAIATEHALADHPGYVLARLIGTCLEQAVPPEAITHLITQALAVRPHGEAASSDRPDGR